MPQLQKERPISISTPLGDDVLLFREMVASEGLGRMFEFRVNLLSEDDLIKLEDVIGQAMTVSLDLPSGAKRYFNGLVSRFSHTGRDRHYVTYQAILRPWLWFLTRAANCRIFQQMTVPEIIKQVFRDQNFTDFDESLSGTYRKWDYCVQYRETDFSFLSRLMEQEGIYYFFKHKDGKHTLVLADSISAHQRTSGYEKVPYYPPTENVVREHEHIFDWSLWQEVQSGSYVLDDFDFERPRADLQVKLSKPGKYAKSKYEVYDYPGEYLETSAGNDYVRTRLEELHAQYERMRGQSDARGLTAGGLFELTNYPRDDQNREYLLVSATHRLHSDAYETGEISGSKPTYACEFEVIDSQRSYRSPRITPKPVVQGPQTAIVVGKKGEEIWTDKHGRVKVQFHWDREGKKDEKSSCWIRVSHPWAGKGWGSVALPRIGQEVIVDFLEGDPDRPIITGRVYNADQTPPYKLPDNQTQSGIKSQSTKSGTAKTFNEMRFEDKKDEEQIYLHAEKDFEQIVENDQTVKIGFDKKDPGSLTLDVYQDRTTTLEAGDDTLTIKKGELKLDVHKDRTTTLQTGNDTVTIKQGDHSLDIKQGDQTIKLGAGKSTLQAMKGIDLKVGGNTIKIDQKGIELKVGGNSIKIDQKGVTITGIMVTVEGKAKLDAKSPMSTIQGDGMMTVKGALVKIN